MAEMKEKIGEMPEAKEVMIDVQKAEEGERVDEKVETWLRKIEKVQGQQVSDQTGQPVMTPVGAATPKIVIPVSRGSFASGFKKKINEAGRWLSAFFLRLIKMKKGEVKFKEE